MKVMMMLHCPKHLQALVDGVSHKITETEKYKIAKLLHKYRDCFVGEDGALGKTNIVKHRDRKCKIH